MTGEVCMFNKFGFCKWEANCKKIHLDEICLLEECESRICKSMEAAVGLTIDLLSP